MNYTKIKKMIEADHQRQKEMLENNVYFNYMDDLNIEIQGGKK